MRLLVIIFLAVSAVTEVYPLRIDRTSQAYKDPASLFESPKNTPQQKYAYKEIILLLTPNEVKSLRENNIFQVSNNELYSRYQENNLLSAHKNEDIRKTIEQSQNVKPVQELQEETSTPASEKLIDIPLFYPFDLITLNNNGKLVNHDKRWMDEIKNLEETLHKNLEIQNTWTPNIQNVQNRTPLPNQIKAGVTPDNLLLLHNSLKSYDNRNIVQDFHRLQYELEQFNNNHNYADAIAKSPHVFLKDDVHETTEKPSFLYQNQLSIHGLPNTLLHAIRPTLKAQSSDNPIDERHHSLH